MRTSREQGSPRSKNAARSESALPCCHQDRLLLPSSQTRRRGHGLVVRAALLLVSSWGSLLAQQLVFSASLWSLPAPLLFGATANRRARRPMTATMLLVLPSRTWGLALLAASSRGVGAASSFLFSPSYSRRRSGGGDEASSDPTFSYKTTRSQRWMGSSPRKRKYKDEVVAAGRTGGDSKAATLDLLEWDKFEFGDSPKWDARFGNNTIASNDEQLDVLAEEETRQDRQMTARLDQEFAAWQTLDPELVQRATSALLPLVKPERVDKIRSVLGRRTSNVRFVYENPSNPSNVWACLRTIDSFGIQHVDVIVQSGKYKGKAAITQKRGMRTALGSAQWLTLRNHLSTEDAIAYIRRQRRKDGGGGEGGGPGFRIYASDVNPTARDIRTIDWNEEAAGGPICIVMGNEESGISDEMRTLVDDTFYLPMAGFAESFNLSVATAVTLAYLNAASGDADSQSSDGAGGGAARGPIRPGDLSQRELDCLVLKGMLSSVANKKAIHAFLKREGIVLPEEIRLL